MRLIGMPSLRARITIASRMLVRRERRRCHDQSGDLNAGLPAPLR